MIAENARLTEIIMVQKGNSLDFFTKEGVYIGSIVEGTVVKEETKTEQPILTRPKSGVTKGPTPDEVKLDEAKQNEKIVSQGPEAVAKKAADKSLIDWQKGKS